MKRNTLYQIFLAISFITYLIIYAPILNIVAQSLDLENFKKAFLHAELMHSLVLSFNISFTTSLLSILFSILICYGLQEQSLQKIKNFRNIFMIPLMFPEIIMGISLLIWFLIIKIDLGYLSLIISHTMLTLPYAVVILTLGLEGFDEKIYEAAKDLGATHNQIFRMITLPMMIPSFAGIFVLSFVLSFDDFLISYFVNGVGNDTLPIKLYSLMRFGITPELKALSVLILLFSLGVSFILFQIQKRIFT